MKYEPFLLGLLCSVLMIIGLVMIYLGDHYKTQQYYNDIRSKIEEGYHVYINGQSVDGSKIDIEMISTLKIKVNDDDSEILITITE